MSDDNYTKYSYSKVWSCVGSAGVVNPADLGKVIFSGVTVQLVGLGGIVAAAAAPAAAVARVAVEEIEALIRYPVTPVSGVATSPEYETSQFSLGIRCLIGQGTIDVKAIGVDVLTGAETTVCEWNSDEFLIDAGQSARDTWLYSPFDSSFSNVDFIRNAYYVQLTLSAKAPLGSIVRSPPAVSVIQWLDPKALQQLGA